MACWMACFARRHAHLLGKPAVLHVKVPAFARPIFQPASLCRLCTSAFLLRSRGSDRMLVRRAEQGAPGSARAALLQGHRARQLLQRGALRGQGLSVRDGESSAQVLLHAGAGVVRQVLALKRVWQCCKNVCCASVRCICIPSYHLGSKAGKGRLAEPALESAACFHTSV